MLLPVNSTKKRGSLPPSKKGWPRPSEASLSRRKKWMHALKQCSRRDAHPFGPFPPPAISRTSPRLDKPLPYRSRWHLMPLVQVIVLALVQGFTEFLPVSSTAHLYLTSWLLNWQIEALDFDIALHIGTLLAVLIYFFRDWVQIIGQGFGIQSGADHELKKNRMLLWLLVIGTIPVALFGLLFNKQAETVWRTPYVMGTMLVTVGL